MNLAKGKILYPFLVKSPCTIYDVNLIFNSYNDLTYPLIFLDLMNSLGKQLIKQRRSFAEPKDS